MGYKYYDSPEGHDAFKKLLVTLKYAGVVGVGAATMDVLTLSKPKGYGSTLGRYAYYTFPLMGMAAAFTTTTYIATNYRQKDDKLNYVLGSLAAGGVFGAWRKSGVAAMWGCVILSAAAIVKKDSVQNGWTFFSEPKMRAYNTVNSFKTDYSLIKHKPGNWTTEAK